MLPTTPPVPLHDIPYRELFLSLIEEIPDAVFTKDLQGRYTLINKAGARFMGRPAHEILGRKDAELMSEQEAQATLEFDRQVLLAGRTLSAEMSEVMAGVERNWLSTKGVLRRADGQVVGLFGIARDLSDHRRSEEARHQSETLYRAAASSSLDAFFILGNDPEGLRLLRVNVHAEALLGCGARQAEGRLLSDFEHLPFIAPRELCEEVWRTGQTRDDEVEQEMPWRGTRWFRRQMNAVGDCVAVTVRDITEQRQAEARLRLNERMASIGMLAAGVAHEINNPLAFVSSNLGFVDNELRRLKLPEEDARELLEAVGEAREGAERMRLIVQSLKLLSRGDPISMVPVDLQEVLESSVQLARGQMRGRAEVVRDYEELPKVLGNTVQLAQVFVNLLSNAAQALPHRGGQVKLVTRVLGGDRVSVEVCDNGCGIPAEQLGRIFEPFFTTKPVGEGTGLGLSISHGIVQALGGEITVESTQGVGTTFRVVLPTVDSLRDEDEEGPRLELSTSSSAQL
jgi:PAS domain S-box-containing protein